MYKRIIYLVVAIASLALIWNLAPPVMVSEAQAAVECRWFPANGSSGRTLVLIQGIDTSASWVGDQVAKWSFIFEMISDLYSQVLYFSYDPDNPDAYAEEATYASIYTSHVYHLYDLLESCNALYGLADFDLVGHSMGGVIALEYIKAFGLIGDQAGWVHHVVTMDSPVNGSINLATGNITHLPWASTAWQSQAAQDMALSSKQREDKTAENLTLAQRLREAGTYVWTATNVDDLAVPISDSVIVGYDLQYPLGSDGGSLNDLSALAGHNQIYRSNDFRHDLREILSASQTASTATPVPAAGGPEATGENLGLLGLWTLQSAPPDAPITFVTIEVSEDGLVRTVDDDLTGTYQIVDDNSILIELYPAEVQMRLRFGARLNSDILEITDLNGMHVFPALTYSRAPDTEDDLQRLWGVWELATPYGGDGYLVLLPDGFASYMFVDSLTYGTYSVSNGMISIRGNAMMIGFERQVSFDLRYSWNGELLSLADSEGQLTGMLLRRFVPSDFSNCMDTIENRLFIGATGRVTITTGQSTRLRSRPTVQAPILLEMPEGTPFFVEGSPECSDGYTWWPIRLDYRNGEVNGWVAEGSGEHRFVELLGVSLDYSRRFADR